MAAAMDEEAVVRQQTERLISAIERRRTDDARAALAAGANPFMRIKDRDNEVVRSAIEEVLAVSWGAQWELVELVLDAVPVGMVNGPITIGSGTDMYPTRNDLTMLHRAAVLHNLVAVRKLLSMGADPLVRDRGGMSVLTSVLVGRTFFGETSNAHWICKELVDAGYKPTSYDLRIVLVHGQYSLANLFMDHGADRIPEDKRCVITPGSMYNDNCMWQPMTGVRYNDKDVLSVVKRILTSQNYNRNDLVSGALTVFVHAVLQIGQVSQTRATPTLYPDFLVWLISAGFDHRERCANGQNYREYITDDERVPSHTKAKIAALLDSWDRGEHPIQLEQQAIATAALLRNLPVELADFVGDFIYVLPGRRGARFDNPE